MGVNKHNVYSKESFEKVRERYRFLYDPAIFWIHKGTQNTNAPDKLVLFQISKPK